MAQTLRIDPLTVYDEGSVALALDISLTSLCRARREKRLRFTRIGHRVFFLGSWLLDWLNADAQEQEVTHAS